jgi:hypothetical protein
LGRPPIAKLGGHTDVTLRHVGYRSFVPAIVSNRAIANGGGICVMTDRFVEVLDPCDRYLIWDERIDQPAVLNGSVLVFARRPAAAAFAAMLNRLEVRQTAGEILAIAARMAEPELRPPAPDSAAKAGRT